MFFTRFPINMTRRETRAMLSSPYRMHAAVAGSFSSVQKHDTGRVLWRVDEGENRSTNLFIVSPSQPSLVGLDEQIGWPDLEGQWVTRDYDTVLAGIAEGQRYRFRLVANPVVSRKAIRTDGGRSKRLPHVTVVQHLSWIIGVEAYEGTSIELPAHLKTATESRALRNGFTVARDLRSNEPQITVSNIKQLRFKRGRGGNWISLATAQYDGILEVTDAGKLKHALTCGIGHGKGFGCGLLTLAPLMRHE